MPTHQAVQVESTGGPLGLVEVQTTSPGRDHVRIDVAACGVCGTDRAIINGAFPGTAFPLTPGHEIAGTIAEVGEGVEGFTVGDRVAVRVTKSLRRPRTTFAMFETAGETSNRLEAT